MRFQTSETVTSSDSRIVLQLLEARLCKVARQVLRSEQANNIQASFSSLVQNSTAIFSVRGSGAKSLLTADVDYRPSLAFWVFLGFTLPTALGWLIPLGCYISRKSDVRSAIEDVLQHVKDECELGELPASIDPAGKNLHSGNAEQTDAISQHNMGDAYYTGKGVKQDYVEAACWFRKAAEQGFANSQTNLGMMYYIGQGVPQDYEQSVAWYRKAAEQGDAEAQFNVGNAYYNGEGIEKDEAEGICWWRKAAAQGLEEAQNNLDVVSK